MTSKRISRTSESFFTEKGADYIDAKLRLLCRDNDDEKVLRYAQRHH
ncbi:MAG: hypothetical protein J4G14_14165 [Dehalococcoidia bacterium]|nr:hypothetical protein [Dehalococcoidia bacterium]